MNSRFYIPLEIGKSRWNRLYRSLAGVGVCMIIFMAGFSGELSGQIVQGNVGFELNTFTGWTGTTGQCCPIYAPNTGIDTSRHVITSGNFTDPHSNGLLPVVAPGSTYSARLGNDNNSAESEVLEFEFTVPADSVFLKIHFAAVLENGLHPSSKQPRFTYSVTSSTGQPRGCTEVSIVAGEGNPDFILNDDMEFYLWQTRIVDLTGLSGNQVTIRFETGDCGPGGHFGYAYIDCELISASLQVSGCTNDGSLTVVAPEGIEGVWQNGYSGDTLIIASPGINDDYFLEVNAGPGCSFRLPVVAGFLLPQANFDYQIQCNHQVLFSNLSTAGQGGIYEWDFGDGLVSDLQSPVHNYSEPGNYTSTLTVTAPNNCKGTASANIGLLPENEITISNNGHCPGKIIELTPVFLLQNSPVISYSWYVNNLFHENSNPFIVTFEEEAIYIITLITENVQGCRDTINAELSIVNDTLCIPAVISPFIPNAFTPNGDGVNDIFEIPGSGYFEGMELTILNRFGEIICDEKYWDGTENGHDCPGGIYVYRLIYKHENISHTVNGTISLIR